MSDIAIVSVDDEKIILDSIRMQLENKYRDKFVLEFAESAEEALEVIDSLTQTDIKILLVISDYNMPGMKGDEFAQRLKIKFPSINIVMLTGQITSELSTELVNKKMVIKVIQKPWKEDDLFSLLNKLMIHGN